MKQSRFESEYADSDLPTFEGAPATHAAVRVSSDAEIPWTQMSVLLGDTVLQAAKSFYLAKRSMQHFADLSEGEDPVGEAIAGINGRLMRMAVLDIAALNDGGLAQNDPESSRTASLPTAHRRMKRHLTAANAPADDLNQLQKLQADINGDNHTPLKYVRHLRNKWAGHPSLDRRFDAWAEADKTLSIPTVEAALVRLVNNGHDTAAFVASTPALADFRQPAATANLDGSIPMEAVLGNVILWAGVERENAGANIGALRARLEGQG